PPPQTLFPYTTLFRARREGYISAYGQGQDRVLLHRVRKRDTALAGAVPGLRRVEHARGGADAAVAAARPPGCPAGGGREGRGRRDRKSTRLNSSHVKI